MPNTKLSEEEKKELTERFLDDYAHPKMTNRPFVINDWWLDRIDSIIASKLEEKVKEIREEVLI